MLDGTVIRATLATREEVYAQRPATLKKVMRMFDRTLRWLAHHSAQEVVARLAGQPGFDSAQSKLLVNILQHNQGMFTNQIAWDAQAVATTERFFHRMAANLVESHLSFADFVRNSPEN